MPVREGLRAIDAGPLRADGSRVIAMLPSSPSENQPDRQNALSSGGVTPGDAVAPAGFDATFARRHACRLLVAEDNLINQRVMRSILRRLGFEPVIVSDGREVIDALLAAPYDVVLMDVEMPGLNGLEATARIRAELPAAKQPVIIAVTAHAGANKREELLAAGMDEYLAKPLQMERLTDLLSRWPELHRAV